MRFPSFEHTVLYFSRSEEVINILPVITNGDYADDINYHYFQLLHPARPCQLWGQLPAEEPPPAAFISRAEWMCVCLSPSPSAFLHLFLPPFLAFVSSCYPLPYHLRLASVGEQRKPHVQSRVARWMNEVKWMLIVERYEMSSEGIRCTDCADSIPFLSVLSPPSSYFILLSHLISLSYFLSSVSRSVYLLCRSPFPLLLTPDMKHPFSPHEIWREPSWIVYRLAARMPVAAGGQAQVCRKAAVGERTGPHRYAQNLLGTD